MQGIGSTSVLSLQSSPHVRSCKGGSKIMLAWMICWTTQCSRALSPGACLGSLRTNTLQKSLHQTFSRAVQCYWCLSRTFILKEARSISLVGLQTLTPHKKAAHALLIWNVSLIIFWYTFCSPLLTSQHCFNYGLGSNRQLLHHWNKNATKQPWRIANRFHVQMENGGIQQSNMDSHPQRFHPKSSTFMARGAQEPSREHEQTSDGCALTCSTWKGAFTAAPLLWKIVQCPDMSNAMVCHQSKQDGGTFCTLSKEKLNLW